MSTARTLEKLNSSLPNRKIACSLIEGYIQSRAATWGIKSTDETLLSSQQTSKDKLTVCISMLKLIDQCRTESDWLKTVYELVKLEADNKSGAFSNFLTKTYLKNEEQLPNLIHALLSYILSELGNEIILRERDRLDQQCKLLEGQINDSIVHKMSDSATQKQEILKNLKECYAALSSANDYHHKFYIDVIKNNKDTNNQHDFNQYSKMVLNDDYELAFCNKLHKVEFTKKSFELVTQMQNDSQSNKDERHDKNNIDTKVKKERHKPVADEKSRYSLRRKHK